MEVIDRARKYLAAMDPSVSGSGGHTAAFKAAVALVQGFDLSQAEAMELLRAEFNPRCSPPWSEKELIHKVREADKAGGDRGHLLRGGRSEVRSSSRPVAPTGGVEPQRTLKRPEFDRRALDRAQLAGFHPDVAWLAERSPVDPRGVTPAGFLDHLFEKGEKALVFTNFYSQGEFGHVAGSPGQTWRLGRRPRVAPERGALPSADRCGAWFLPSPVDGAWHPTGATDLRGAPILSRRSGPSVTAWRHLLLESDEVPDREWLNLLAQLPLPISALYTSGGRSIHALVRIEAKSKGAFDAFRDRISPLIAKLGGDAAALSGVRLTRLPGVMRNGTEKRDGGKMTYLRYPEPRLQRLLYLNPEPEIVALKSMPRLREVKEVGRG